jgi:predicted adenylyl cyclase CyaB
MQTFEVEIKSLLGSPERAETLRRKMMELDPSTSLTSKNTQLNHYFTGGEISRLAEAVADLISPDAAVVLKDLATKARDFSVRTRQKDAAVILVVKASVDDTTSSNGISRMEFEETVPVSLAELDQRLLDAGFQYQAKWSREREEYLCNGANICLDKNAGYGYLAEFEKVLQDQSEVEAARDELRALMAQLEAEELVQDRLERMFAHYNSHWAEYYGTDKIFIIE